MVTWFNILQRKKIWKDSINFQHWKMTLKIRILRCSRRLFIILVSLTVTLFSEKMLISTRCIHGFMSNTIKKSWTVSIGESPPVPYWPQFCELFVSSGTSSFIGFILQDVSFQKDWLNSPFKQKQDRRYSDPKARNG